MVWVMATEKNFENRIKQFLQKEGCWFIKYWGGGYYTKEGIPDILACVNGQFVAIEVKAPNGRPTPMQIKKLMDIDKSHGWSVLLYPNNFTLFQNFILCLKADMTNAKLNYDLLKERWMEWVKKYKLI